MSRRRPALLAAVTAVVASLLVSATASGAEAASKPAPRKLTAQATRDLAGVYVGACDTAAYKAWVKQQGGAPSIISEFLDMRSWDAISDPTFFTNCWGPYLSRYTSLSIAVPMIPRTAGVSLAQGAAGDYDSYFQTLGQRLVAGGAAGSYLRVGWEFNGDWQPWRAAANPKAYVADYRRIVQILKSVPGQHFKFVWSVNYGYTESDATKLYPGNDVVDYVGLSAYDQGFRSDFSYPLPSKLSAAALSVRRANAWADIATGYRGLDYWATFARKHKRKVVIAEWGLARNTGPGSNKHGGGDDTDFLKRFHTWMLANNVQWASYWNQTSGWDGQLGTRANGKNYLPKSTKLMKTLFKVKR